MAASTPLVSIIIPVFNNLQYTRGCLDAIWRNSGTVPYEIIVGDDGSTDGTREYLLELGARVHPVLHTSNTGFILNCNAAAEQARGEFLVFLNNDTLPQAGWLEALLEPMKDPGVGITGARMVWPDGRILEAASVVFSDGSAWNVGRREQPNQPKYNHVREVDYVSGGGLMVRTSLWRQLGGFDTRYCPAYYDDIDLCFAARRAGYKVLYVPFSWIVHFEGVTGGKDISQGVKRYQLVNKGKFSRKWAAELRRQQPPSPGNVARASWRGTGKFVLWIDHMLPVPNFNSGCLRMNHLMRTMVRQGHRVTYATLVGTDPGQYGREMQKAGVRVAHLGYEEWEHAESQRKNIIVDKLLDALELEAMQYEIVYLSFYWVGSHFIDRIRRRLPKALIYVDSHDIHYLRTRREAELYPDDQHIQWARQTRRDELAVYAKADAVLTVTEQDKAVLLEDLPEKPVLLMPNVHDVVPCTQGFAGRKDLLFVGGFNHTPNVDAMTYFCAEILPAVRLRKPGIRLWIVGSNPPAGVQALACDDITVTGWVDSTKPYLDACQISIAPIRYGAGMKGKIGEAMAHGLPVITTPVGAEGMDIEHGRHALVASTPAEWVEAIAELSGDEDLWNRLSAGGQELMSERYGTQAMENRAAALLSVSSREALARQRAHNNPAAAAAPIPIRPVSIVLLTHNQLTYTRECLASIRRNTRGPYSLIVVDNASTDGTPEYLETLPWIRLIRSRINLGFPAGCNKGIAAAGRDDVLLLNNDTVVTRGWLERLAGIAALDSTIGIVAPVSNRVSGAQAVADASYTNSEQMEKFALRRARKYAGDTMDFPRVAFLCTWIRRELLDEIGGLDERFSPGNYEDDDFCLRAQLAGYRATIAIDTFIHHYGSVSFAANGAEAYKQRLEKNRETFIRKWGASPDDIWLKGATIKRRELKVAFTDEDGLRKLEQAKQLLEEGEYSLAASLLRQALEGWEEKTTVPREDLLDLAGHASLLAGELDEAKGFFERELTVIPSSSRPCSGLGNVLERAGQFSGSKVMFEWAVKLDSANEAACQGLTRTNRALGLPDDDNTLLAGEGVHAASAAAL